jgi:hypothetical protein
MSRMQYGYLRATGIWGEIAAWNIQLSLESDHTVKQWARFQWPSSHGEQQQFSLWPNQG